MKQRPWKKHARIDRVEFNSGDVKFRTLVCEAPEDMAELPPGARRVIATQNDGLYPRGEFESLDEAVRDLDAWWAEWWPKQVKARKPA